MGRGEPMALQRLMVLWAPNHHLSQLRVLLVLLLFVEMSSRVAFSVVYYILKE